MGFWGFAWEVPGWIFVSSSGEEPKMSSRELSTSGSAWSVWVEVIVVAGDAGAEGELEPRDFGIAGSPGKKGSLEVAWLPERNVEVEER